MNNNGWITDREPTVEEEEKGIWVTSGKNSVVYKTCVFQSEFHIAWQPANVPAPYVPPEEPKPCPACGCENIIDLTSCLSAKKRVQCLDCFMSGPFRLPPEHITAWNRIMVKEDE